MQIDPAEAAHQPDALGRALALLRGTSRKLPVQLSAYKRRVNARHSTSVILTTKDPGPPHALAQQLNTSLEGAHVPLVRTYTICQAMGVDGGHYVLPHAPSVARIEDWTSKGPEPGRQGCAASLFRQRVLGQLVAPIVARLRCGNSVPDGVHPGTSGVPA